MVGLRQTALLVCLVGVFSFGPVAPARAGLEFCFTPECSDGDPCTCDFQGTDGTCQHDPRTRWASAARASGIQIDAGGRTVLQPTPDSNVKNPDSLLTLPADPLAHVDVLKVEELEENPNDHTQSHAKAVVTGGRIRVLDRGSGNWLLSVDAIQAVSESFADDTTATSSSDGSTLTHVVLNGTNIGDVHEPMSFSFQDPILHQRIDVRLLQKLPVGGAAGDPVPDPEFGVVYSGVTVNAIRVTVRDVTDPAHPKTEADIIIGRADTRVDRFGAASCQVANPAVSGSGLVLAVDGDESAIDPLRQLTRLRVGEVLLPSTGGSDDATLAHVGPIVDLKGNLVAESNTAFSHTEGTVDPSAGTARSGTTSAIEELRAFDLGDGPQLSADLVRAECDAGVGDGSPASQASTTLVGLKLGGQDLCEQLHQETNCTPAPNTEVQTGIPGVKILLNEQIPDTSSGGGTGITVNAVHVQVLGAGNPLNLPLGADVVVSRAHCDAKPVGGSSTPGSATTSGASTSTSDPTQLLGGLLGGSGGTSGLPNLTDPSKSLGEGTSGLSSGSDPAQTLGGLVGTTSSSGATASTTPTGGLLGGANPLKSLLSLGSH